MDLTRLKALIDLVSQSTVSELEITEGGVRVRIVKSAATTQPRACNELVEPQALSAQAQRATFEAATKVPRDARDDDGAVTPGTRTGPHAVTSPSFGIFHRAQSPESPPYVQVGSQVQAGDTLCLIEAMKSFSAIAADRNGTVSAILVENGQEVEPGQVLIQIGA
jgi:acetyl-CoA carboxylase biotin carboxyl carrier protein